MIFLQNTWNNKSKTKHTTVIYPTAEMKDPYLHWEHPGHKIITQKCLITPQEVPATQTLSHADRNANACAIGSWFDEMCTSSESPWIKTQNA